ncbi:cytochrome b5-like heme/steroid binding domain-containing protein [Ilyonectria sp. MPI-CAGE-AT-0026]|nr:cytochrome b5-like heme/steroid binding domain-containing protein [Ilyonectria sp. MPI-CAGE-AT-0026]
MSKLKQYSYQDIAEKEGLFLVIHNNAYDCTKFAETHPGGEDVLLDLAGQDATEAFEGVGHSEEARECLDSLFLGALKQSVSKAASKFWLLQRLILSVYSLGSLLQDTLLTI